MKSFDRQSLEEQTRLVSRYVAGDLSRSERAEFEAWLVASPELASEVEMERRLRRGIASAARRGWLQRKGSARSSTTQRRWHLAAAASGVLALMALGAVLVTPPHPGTTSASAPNATPSRLLPAPRVDSSRPHRLVAVPDGK